jgi:hypothetical protein
MKLTFKIVLRNIVAACHPEYFTERPLKILRVMKITAIIVLMACLHVSAGGFSQNVTLKVKDASLKEVFASLQKQSGYYFICTKEVLNQTVSVTADIRNEPLTSALNTLLFFQRQTAGDFKFSQYKSAGG